MTDTSQWPAAPVYSPRDYVLILKLSQVGDLPPTWDQWWENFKASEAEQRRQGFPAIRVSVHAGKFKAWLQENSLSSSEQTRQQFAQQWLDRKRERKAARLAVELQFGERLWAPAPPPQPAPWSHGAIEICALALLAIAISTAAVVGALIATSSGILYRQEKATLLTGSLGPTTVRQLRSPNLQEQTSGWAEAWS